MSSRSLGHRAPLLWILLPWMAGLALAHMATGPLPVTALFVGAGAALVVAVWGRRGHPAAWAAGLVAGVALLAAAHHETRRARLPAWDALPPREAELTVRITRLFATPDEAPRAGGLGEIVGTAPHLHELRGQRIYFSTTAGAGEWTRSARTTLVGVLAALPKHPEPGSFDRYLADSGVNFKLTRGRVVGEPRGATAYRVFCERARHRMSALLGVGIEHRPELAGVSRAMLLGQKRELSEEQVSVFMQSGTMHLFAISGLHIAVIAGAIEMLLLLARVPARARFVAGTAALWLYVDITGAPPSAVRAFVMVAFVHASWRWRVPGNSAAALVASALVVLVIAPEQLFTASFQMSYAIVAALLLFSLPLIERWQERWAWFESLPRVSWDWRHHTVDWLCRKTLSLVGLGCGAALVSTVSGVAFFGLFTPGAFFSNLVLIPAAGAVLTAGFLSVVGGLVGATGLSVVFNHAAALVLWLMQGSVEFAVAVPGTVYRAAFVEPWLAPVALAFLLATVAYGYTQRWSGGRGGWWPPVAVVVLTLVLAVRFG